MLVLLLISTSVGAWLMATDRLGMNESYAAGGILLLMLLVLFFIQRFKSEVEVRQKSEVSFDARAPRHRLSTVQ